MAFFMAHFNYWIYVILMMIGLNAMISKNNLIKKLIGMSIFQTAIMLFYVSIGVKHKSDIPILHHEPEHGEALGHGVEATARAAGHAVQQIDPAHYANPLPHVLMLTAIVVGVATLGVAMAVVQRIHERYGSIEEDDILARVKR